ncbi:sulfite exporter TauE/SafE family protein [Botrimarina hoheduenensis]|uniref:Urease accessory protein UreH-like transmembrane domain-containing protein n=1 Tax=Botrimarina hoheduenensis TaxID=2528000 RepID=A0A5C5VSQ4_9BACT|nr:sulfite exporter TauE/SafE family protein [Botrimarina hoheduenensis]TWT40771.1 hypothetical protein Pla111_31890 [Botrimarina hoheduenensis]
MTSLLLAVLAASLFGSLHCAGMCGPLCAIAVSGNRRGGSVAALHAAYHGGRLVSYALVGAIAGSAGAMLDLASTLAGLQPFALAAAGGMMILFGFAEIARQQKFDNALARWGHWRPPQRWTQTIQRGQRFAAKQPALPRALVIGLLTTLLPCGWLYAFVVTAAGAGAPLTGATVMAVFWLGTLPVMLTLGVGVRRLSGLLGDRLPVLTATALVAVGLVTLSGRLALEPQAIAAQATADAAAHAAAVPNPDQLPACCRAGKEQSE